MSDRLDLGFCEFLSVAYPGFHFFRGGERACV